MYWFTQNLDTIVKDNPFDDEGRKIRESKESLMRTRDRLESGVVPINPKSLENVKINSFNEETIKADDRDSVYQLSEPVNYNNEIFEELVNNLKDDVELGSNYSEPEPETFSRNDNYSGENYNYNFANSYSEYPGTERPFNVDSTYTEFSEAKNTMANMHEKAERARREADESDRLLESLIAKSEQMQRELKEAEMRNRAVEQELATVLQTQREALNQEIKRAESIINDSNMRTERNSTKINEFQNLIKSTEARTNEMNEKIFKSEQLLSSLHGLSSFDENSNTYGNGEDGLRKVA